MKTAVLSIGVLLCAGVLASPADNFDVQPLAKDVYAVIRKDPPGFMVDANNLFIIGPDDVIVVDANGAPGITRAVLAALRTLTTKPVRYVINTHYHDDHIRGNSVYRDAFPGVDFVAHAFAKTYLPGQGAVNRKNFLEGAPQFQQQLKDMLKSGKGLRGENLTAEERTSMANDVDLAGYVLSNGASAETVLPTITVDDRLTLESGARTVEIRHLGAGHTAADLVVWLPQDRIVATGDLVAWPVPLVGDPQSHIASWSGALEAIKALRPSIVVPGHGPVLRDTSYLSTLSAMFRSIADQTSTIATRGGTLAEARKAVNLDAFKKTLAGESPVRLQLFDMYVAGPAIGAAFKDAGGSGAATLVQQGTVHPWTPSNISSPRFESHAAFDPKTGDLYFVRSSPQFQGWRLMMSRCTAAGWSTPEPPAFAGDGVEADPFFTPDGTLFFISSRSTDGIKGRGLDLWRVDRDPSGAWKVPERLPEPLNSSGAEWFPRPSADGWLYFGSDRAGGLGATDIWRARRTEAGQWEVSNLGPTVNTAGDEYEAMPSPDGQRLIVMADGGLYESRLSSDGWSHRAALGSDINQPGLVVGPLFSPSGHSLLFARDTKGPASGEFFVWRQGADEAWPPDCRAKL